MNCPKWEMDVASYAGGDLPADRVVRTLAHLESCAACRELADDLRAGQSLLSALGDEPLEDAMAANVRRRVMARLPGERPDARRRYWVWALAAATALAAILILPRQTTKPAPVARKQAMPSSVAAAPIPVPVLPVTHPVMRRHRHAPPRQVKPQTGEPLLVQLVTNDPNIVIYWLVDPKPQGD